jgi:hypothetical protein
MSGRRIDDHSFWAGKGGKDSVLPESTRVKSISDVKGDGAVERYEDTEEAVKSQQMAGVGKMKSYKHKSGYRN